jgi:hypothetical protein
MFKRLIHKWNLHSAIALAGIQQGTLVWAIAGVQ